MAVWYYKCDDDLEVIDVISRVVDGLEGEKAFCLGNVIKYVMRAGRKTSDPDEDLRKANDYAYRLVKGVFKNQLMDEDRKGKKESNDEFDDERDDDFNGGTSGIEANWRDEY